MTSGERLHVIGTGLIGTSVALAALGAGWTVTVSDADEGRRQEALQLLRRVDPELSDGTREGIPTAPPSLICVAVPPSQTPSVVNSSLGLNLDVTVFDTASIKTHIERELEIDSRQLARFVGSHPLAGSERSGPDAARADLFRGRSWVVCPRAQSAPASVALVERLIHACGAHPVRLDPGTHDRLLATTSHLPQLVASALATLVAEAFDRPDDTAAVSSHGLPTDAAAVGHFGLPSGAAGAAGTAPSRPEVSPSALAGPALLDMTRIAASPSQMWAEIAAANHEPLRAGLTRFLERLTVVRDGLSTGPTASTAVRDLVDEGRAARQRLGLKHPGAPGPARVPMRTGWTWVDAVIDDTPGTLARVFAAAAEIGVNVEDVRVDHAPYASTGVVSVAVSDLAQAARLTAELSRPGLGTTARTSPDGRETS